jgi:hypothetical protein
VVGGGAPPPPPPPTLAVKLRSASPLAAAGVVGGCHRAGRHVLFYI